MEWKDEKSGGCIAEVGERMYIVREFTPGRYDGDPLLTMNDPEWRRRHQTCWGLRVWQGNDTKGPVRLFAERWEAQLAAEEVEQAS